MKVASLKLNRPRDHYLDNYKNKQRVTCLCNDFVNIVCGDCPEHIEVELYNERVGGSLPVEFYGDENDADLIYWRSSDINLDDLAEDDNGMFTSLAWTVFNHAKMGKVYWVKIREITKEEFRK